MKTLADVVLDYYWHLTFTPEEELDPDTAMALIEDLGSRLEALDATERAALQDAARRSLAAWTREPDAYGHTPRALLDDERRAFLQLIIDGHFSGPPLE